MDVDTSFLRAFCFFSSCLFFGAWEFFYPAHPQTQQKSKRWVVNLCLATISVTILKFAPLIPPFLLASSQLNAYGALKILHIEGFPAVLLSFIALDMMIYWQHRVFHRVPWLWKWHQVHHEDQDLDLTSGVRFHPVEMVLSTFIKMVGVLVVGADPMGVLLAEIVLNTSAMFQHSNISLQKLDGPLQKFIVTPHMHRIHHSIQVSHTDSNFSFSISLWDHLFKTYQPPFTQEQFPLGTQALRRQTPYSISECLNLHMSSSGTEQK